MNKLESLKNKGVKGYRDITQEHYEISELVSLIELEFENIHSLYKEFTYKVTGHPYDWFDRSVINCEDVLTLDGLNFFVEDSGGSARFFLSYVKKTAWWKPNKHKVFYCVRGYDFHTEKWFSDRYNFSVEDYKFILEVLMKESKLLVDGINSKWG